MTRANEQENRALKAEARIKELEAELDSFRSLAELTQCYAVECKTLDARIKELEAERDAAQRDRAGMVEQRHAAWKERDAIEAATIERCLDAVRNVIWPPNQKSSAQLYALDAALDAIRALKPPVKEGK